MYGYRIAQPGIEPGMVILGFLILVVALGVLGLLAATMLRQRGGTPFQYRRSSAGGPSDAFRILDERFARGEIDEDEYERRRATLSRHG